MSRDLNRFTSPAPKATVIAPQQWSCSLCSGRGVVFAVRTGAWVDRPDLAHGREWVAHEENDRTTPTIFRCSCYRGQNDRRAFPRWDNAPTGEFRMAKI